MKRFQETKERFLTSFTAVVMMLTLLMGTTPNAFAANKLPFSDVASNDPHYDDICWAVEKDIVTGYDGTFRPNQKVTILEFFTMLSRSISEGAEDTANFGAEKDSMTYHLRRSISKGWTIRYDTSLEMQKNEAMNAGFAWNAALTASGMQVYCGHLYGAAADNEAEDGMRAAKELGLANQSTNAYEDLTRGEAVSLLRAASENTKKLAEPAIVQEMKSAIEGTVPKGNFNEFYAKLQKVPEPIRKAFAADGWKISFDRAAVKAYEKKTGNQQVQGLTDYSKKKIYLVDATAAVLHEMGHYYQEKVYSSGMDKDVYKTFDRIQEKEIWCGSIFGSGTLQSGKEFFATAFDWYVRTGAVRSGANGQNEKDKLESQHYFDNLAHNGWVF